MVFGAHRPSFTLIEILIVVVILGVLAAIVIPQFVDVGKDVEQMAFVADVRIFVDAAQRYMLDTGQYLEDSASGTTPMGWEPYIDEAKWVSLTPIGGVWDFELNSYGVVSGFGVDFANGGGPDRDDAYMQEIDAVLDDGDLNTGAFQKLVGVAQRYYYIIED